MTSPNSPRMHRDQLGQPASLAGTLRSNWFARRGRCRPRSSVAGVSSGCGDGRPAPANFPSTIVPISSTPWKTRLRWNSSTSLVPSISVTTGSDCGRQTSAAPAPPRKRCDVPARSAWSTPVRSSRSAPCGSHERSTTDVLEPRPGLVRRRRRITECEVEQAAPARAADGFDVVVVHRRQRSARTTSIPASSGCSVSVSGKAACRSISAAATTSWTCATSPRATSVRLRRSGERYFLGSENLITACFFRLLAGVGGGRSAIPNFPGHRPGIGLARTLIEEAIVEAKPDARPGAADGLGVLLRHPREGRARTGFHPCPLPIRWPTPTATGSPPRPPRRRRHAADPRVLEGQNGCVVPRHRLPALPPRPPTARLRRGRFDPGVPAEGWPPARIDAARPHVLRRPARNRPWRRPRCANARWCSTPLAPSRSGPGVEGDDRAASRGLRPFSNTATAPPRSFIRRASSPSC